MQLYDNLAVAAIPLDIVLGDKNVNLAKAEDAIKQLPPNTDIAVLPEMFTTSLPTDKAECQRLAEDNDGPTMAWARQIARKHNLALAGSFLARTGDRLYNRAFLIEPGGEAIFYDKHHTFCLGSESEIISRGDALPPVARFRGWNISIAVCYDLRFPVWLRNASMKYDLMLIPANWPKARAYAWEHLLQARAIENQAYIVGANRGGVHGAEDFDDLSYIFDHKGLSMGSVSTACVHAVLSKTALQKFRNALPALRDADSFTINL